MDRIACVSRMYILHSHWFDFIYDVSFAVSAPSLVSLHMPIVTALSRPGRNATFSARPCLITSIGTAPSQLGTCKHFLYAPLLSTTSLTSVHATSTSTTPTVSCPNLTLPHTMTTVTTLPPCKQSQSRNSTLSYLSPKLEVLTTVLYCFPFWCINLMNNGWMSYFQDWIINSLKAMSSFNSSL